MIKVNNRSNAYSVPAQGFVALFMYNKYLQKTIINPILKIKWDGDGLSN